MKGPMKAMVLKAPRELALEDVARPAAGAGEVLVRVTHSGICGTDLKIYSGAIPVQYPRIMGHEMIGEVVESRQRRFPAGRPRHRRSRNSSAAIASIAGSARRTCARTACCWGATSTAALPIM